jgi:uncharacterized protein YutE (UPF0331/DUF86 family)
MTQTELVARKLTLITTCVTELRTLGRPAEIPHDSREQHYTERMLQIALQSALDIAAHIVSDDALGDPRTNREIFELLVRYNWLPQEMADSLNQMVGLRNILVHGYESVDPHLLQQIVENDLDDLLSFVSAIRERLASE